HLLLVGVEVGLLAVLGGGVELRPQVLELLHTTRQEGEQAGSTVEQSRAEARGIWGRNAPTCRALTKLLLRSMEASSTVAPSQPPGLRRRRAGCCSSCCCCILSFPPRLPRVECRVSDINATKTKWWG
uniref:Uncharacterized protein n=1 Tax=Aegilops tauschii subsp. strangulata TaxID=200361 RepID=A0A453A1K1_AEGTS